MTQKLKLARRLVMIAIAIAGTGVSSFNAASLPYLPNASEREAASQRVDTRSYRHCHNNEGRFAHCYTRKQGEAMPDVSPARKAKYDYWWFNSDDGRRKYQ